MNIVVVGGGFGGVRAALEFSRRKAGRVTLVSQDEHLHHHEIFATARLGETPDIGVALVDIFANHPDVTVVKDEIVSLDSDRRIVIGKAKSYQYDELVMALGARSVDMHHDAVEVIERFYAKLESDLSKQRHFDKIFTVVGAGAMGVELATAIKLRCDSLVRAARSPSRVRVQLVDKEPRLLTGYSQQASRAARHQLKRAGVDIVLGATAYPHDSHVRVGQKKYPAADTIWLTGTQSNRFYREHPRHFVLSESGSVEVDPHLEAYPHIYVIGENTQLATPDSPKGALDMADYVIEHIIRQAVGRLPLPYRPSTVVTMFSIGDNWAYVECLGIYITGRFARWVQARIERVNCRKIMNSTLADIYIANNKKRKSPFKVV